MSAITVDIARHCDGSQSPDNQLINDWVKIAYQGDDKAEVAMLIVDKDEIQELNKTYRDKDYPTNVLSFAANLAPIDGTVHLGDIVLCSDIIEQEATEQKKTLLAHWAHMTIHGMLHLQNYDHTQEAEAKLMEDIEIALLAELGFDNPYV